MLYRRLDASGDYSFGKSKQDFLSGAEAVAQAVKTNLLLLKGEWWEDVAQGLPLFQSILGQPGITENIRAADLIIKERIAATKGVSSIDDFQSDYSSRNYSIVCTITAYTGETSTVEVSL
ncbi:MAG TPA: hypothetical protein DCZ10_15775 [Pelotomaculum sp.]|nr:hypothetical protein [Pelotomaculum sp.]